MFIDDALSTNVQERPTCMTFPNPRETEPVLELEKRTSRLLLALVRLKAGVVYPMYTAPVVFKIILSGSGGVV